MNHQEPRPGTPNLTKPPIPGGTFHAGGVIQCPNCGHVFAIDSYAWRTHRRTCKG